MNSDYWRVFGAVAGTSALAGFAVWCIRDYYAYLALGPGGPPYNMRGWAWITFAIRPFALSAAKTTMVADYPIEGYHSEIRQLPCRQGDRPRLGGIAPHRQLSQHAPEQMRKSIENLFTNAAVQHSNILEMRRSVYERHHDALFVSQSLLEHGDTMLPTTAQVSRGEIAHVHTDLSIHLYLSPADARLVINKGWAERHRLSVPRTSWVKNRYAVADTYLMVYGPRNEEELDVLRIILENSIIYMTGNSVVGKSQ